MHSKTLAFDLVAAAALFVGGVGGAAAGGGSAISFASCVPDGYSGPAPMDSPVTGCAGPLGPTFGLTPDADGLYWFWLAGCDSSNTCNPVFRSAHFTGCRQAVASDYYDDAATIAACRAGLN